MRRIRTRLWATLLSVCLLLSLLPTTALADNTSSMTYEQLAEALAQSGSGVAFTPDETFAWPEEGGTLTFNQTLLLGGDWTIPENITLVFPEEGGSVVAGDGAEAPAVTVDGAVQLQKGTASTRDIFHPFQGVDVTWNGTSTLSVTGETSTSVGVLIDSEETWTVEAGADLQADLWLRGFLQGNDGVIQGNVIVAPTSDSGEVHADLLGSLTIYGTLTVDSHPGIENSTTLRIVSGAKVSLPEGGLRLGQTRSDAQDVILGIGGELELWGENYINSQVLLLDDSSVLTLRENSSLDQFRDESAPVFDGGYLDGTGTVKVYCDPNDQEGTMPELFMTPFDEYYIDNDGHMNSKDFIRSDVCFWRSWADQCTITLHYDESLCTVKANKLEKGDNGLSDPSKTTLIVTGNGKSAKTPKGTWLQFQIDDIADGYRIGSVMINAMDRTEGFINGAYGGLAFSNISSDYELTAEMEPIPEPLPTVTSVRLYMDPDFTTPAESGSLSKDSYLYAKPTFSDGQSYPAYFLGGVWEYTQDGTTWYPASSWGEDHFDFWPGWEWHEELDFVNDSYDLRFHARGRKDYSAGELYSNVIQVNGGAEAVPSDFPRVTSVRFQEDDVLKWEWDGADFSDLDHLKLSFSQDDGETWKHSLEIIKEDGVIQDSVLFNGIIWDMPTGTYNKIRFETFDASGGVADTYDWNCKLDITYETPSDLPASVTFRKAGEENRYNLTVSGLTAGQRIVVQFYNAPSFDGDRWCPSSFADVTASTHLFSDKFMPDDAFAAGNDLYYIVQQFENMLISGTEMRVKVTNLSAWTKGSLTAAGPTVNSVSFGTSSPQHTLNWSFPDGVTEGDLADCHLKLELYNTDAEKWVLWDNGVYPRLNGGYILEDLLSDSGSPRGHFTKIRVSTVSNSDSEVLGSYEGAIDLTVSETQASGLPAKAVFTKEPDGQYTVVTSGLTVGQVYYVVTDYIDENQKHTQVLATAGGVSVTAATMTAENVPVVGDRESLMADASYRVLQFDTTMSSSAKLSMAITDRSGWKQCASPCEHVWSDWTEIPATCTEDGSKTRTCSSCGHQETEVIDKLGHAWGDWVLTTPPTEGQSGIETRTCSRCSATETRDVAKLKQQDVRFLVSSITKTYGDEDVYNQAKNLTSDGGKLAYASSDPAVAVVDAVSGMVTIKGAGTATITATAAAVPGKYVETSASFTLTVNKAELTIRAADASIVYGQSSPAFSWTAHGFAYQEDESVLAGQADFACAYKTYGAVGTYPVTLTGLSARNYAITFEPGTLTVAKAEKYTIALGKLEQLAGHTSPVTATLSPYDTTGQISVEYLVNGSWTSNVPTEAGSYAVRAALTASDNILFVPDRYTEGTLLIKRGVTVDTGSGTADVDVSVEVDSGKAEISVSEDDLNTILENTDGSVSVDLGGVANVDELVLPGDLVSELSKSGKADSLTVSTEDASITLSGPALDTVAGKVTSGEDKISATLKSVNKSDLNEAQQEALESIPEDAKVVDVSLTVTHPDGSRDVLHELGGEVTITVPYDELPGIIEGQYVVACHVSDTGVVTYLFAVCDRETRTITFTSTHFSYYAAFVSADPAAVVDGGSGSGLYAVGDTVIIRADGKSGYRFDHWEIVSGSVSLSDANSAETTFVMPAGNVELKASYTKASSGGGGGSSTPVYTVTVETPKNGAVAVSPKNASEGDTVTINVQPDADYVLDKLTVLDKAGKEIPVTKRDGKYTFTMPGSRVTVKAAFIKSTQPAETVFIDVPADAYYAEAVKWAVAKGVTAGTGPAVFSPDQPCTRAQVVTFLWRAAGSPEEGQDDTGFTDIPADSYYAKAVRWAVYHGITSGTDSATFSPDAVCTRAQIATFLYRAMGSNTPHVQATPFSDVAEGSYYYDAVLWAVENSITAGTSAATFSPDAACTRAQAITFLYRAMGR